MVFLLLKIGKLRSRERLFFFYLVPAALTDFKISQVSTVHMVGKERGNKACLSQPAPLPVVSGPISITFQHLEHIFLLSAACTPETSFLCTPVTLQSHVFLSCKSPQSQEYCSYFITQQPPPLLSLIHYNQFLSLCREH